MTTLTLRDSGFLGLSRGPWVPWTPAQRISDLWFKGNDGPQPTGGVVTQWNDLSGKGRHLTQATTSLCPVVTPNALNGKNVVTFNQQFMSGAAGALNAEQVYMIAVMKVISSDGTNDLFMGVGATGRSRKLRALWRSSTGTTMGFSGWNADLPNSIHSLDIGGGYHIYEVWNTKLNIPNNLKIARDGVVDTYSTSTGLEPVDDGRFSIGSVVDAYTFYYSNISVAEVIVDYAAPSDASRALLRGYLAWEYGLQGNLPADDPYKFAAP
jgi:hypothetical protein